MWQDLRFGARMLMRNPGFTIIAVISIAIGGANSAMFSVTDGLIFRPGRRGALRNRLGARLQGSPGAGTHFPRADRQPGSRNLFGGAP